MPLRTRTFGNLRSCYTQPLLYKRYSHEINVSRSDPNEKDKAVDLNATIINSNVNQDENRNCEKIEDKHLADQEDWWKPLGKLKILHAVNKLRVPFIKDGLLSSYNRRAFDSPQPLNGLEILDVGRGRGVLSEPLARLGASVTGIGSSASFAMLATRQASRDPSLSKENMFFLKTTIETIAQKEPEKYDAVIATDILEHKQNKQLFLNLCLQALKPGGSIFITTLNRTPNAWIGGLAMPDSILDRVEKSDFTDSPQFITPAEMCTLLKDNGCNPMPEQGMLYLFLNNTWYWTSGKSTSYAMQAIKL